MIITKDSGVNDTSFAKIQAPIRQYLLSSEKLAKSRSLVSEIFPVVNDSSWGSAYGGRTSMSNRFQPGGENMAYPEHDTQDDYTKIIANDITWKSQMSYSQEYIEDGKLSDDQATQFVDNFYDTKEEYCATFLTNATTTSMDFESKTFDIAGADGKALFAVDHPSITGGVSAQSNLYNAEFNDTNLAKMEAILAGQLDANGRRISIVPDTIIVPYSTVSDALQLQSIYETLNATGDPNSANRAGVYNRGRFKIVTWNFLGIPENMTADKSWWMLADSKYIMKYKPFILQMRKDLAVNSWVDKNTDMNVWNGRARMKAGVTNNWRGIVACIPGVGSTLA